MNLRMLIEFSPYNWHPHYRNIKKILRKNRIYCRTLKRMTDEGLLESIWIKEEQFEKATELLSSYNLKDELDIKREAKVEKLSKEFEENWYLYLIALFIHYPVKRPLYFLLALILLLAIILIPLIEYGLIG